jgi:hypothetical protein
VRKRQAFLALVAALVVVAPASASPAKTLAASLQSAHHERSMHYESNGTAAGARVTMVSDIATDRGIQRITFRQGGRTGHVTVMVVSNTAYIRGDAFALHGYMGFPAVDAAGYANKWIAIPHTSSGYASVASGVRLASAIDELTQLGPFTRASATMRHGQKVVGIKSIRSSAGELTRVTIYVQARGADLPVEIEAHRGANHFSATYGRWNEPVNVHAPAHVVHLANSA